MAAEGAGTSGGQVSQSELLQAMQTVDVGGQQVSDNIVLGKTKPIFQRIDYLYSHTNTNNVNDTNNNATNHICIVILIMYAGMYVCMYACMHACMHACLCMYACMYVCM